MLALRANNRSGYLGVWTGVVGGWQVRLTCSFHKARGRYNTSHCSGVRNGLIVAILYYLQNHNMFNQMPTYNSEILK